jgi:hypothetical protein
MQRNTWGLILVLGFVLVLSSTVRTEALDRVSGVLTRTYVIVEDTELSGDVTCDVAGEPCFSFGAHEVQLKLNGFSVTGKSDAATGCAGGTSARESGVNTNGFHRVQVRGPGLIQRFRNHGVNVAGSTDARVEDLTVSTNCGSGIIVAASSFGTLVQGNVAVRNGLAAGPCGGI